MPLRRVSIEEQRLAVIQAPDKLGISVAEACRRWKITRQTFYKWKRRYDEEGLEGLSDRSRRPHTSPRRVDGEIESRAVGMRAEHPRWGARRIKEEMRREGTPAPAASTTHQILRRNGLVSDHPENRPKARYIRFERPAPNDLWQIDATEVRLADGTVVEVIDVEDDFSRLLVATLACPVATAEAAILCVETGIARHGVPRQVLSDNGLAFSGKRRGIEVALERHLRELGCEPICSRIQHPQTLGKLERQHRTFREWAQDEATPETIEELQRLSDRYRHHYNTERPHQGIANQTPQERYRSTPPALPDRTAAAASRPTVPPSPPDLKVADSTGRVLYKKYIITIGVEWAGTSILVVDDRGTLHLYHRDVLVRTVAVTPNKRSYPKGTPRGAPPKPHPSKPT